MSLIAAQFNVVGGILDWSDSVSSVGIVPLIPLLLQSWELGPRQ